MSLYSLCLCALWPTSGTPVEVTQAGRSESGTHNSEYDPDELSTPCLHSSPCSSPKTLAGGEGRHLIPDTHLGLADPVGLAWGCQWDLHAQDPPAAHHAPAPPSVSPASPDPWSSCVFHRCYFSQSPLTGSGSCLRLSVLAKGLYYLSAPSTLSNDLFWPQSHPHPTPSSFWLWQLHKNHLLYGLGNQRKCCDRPTR